MQLSGERRRKEATLTAALNKRQHTAGFFFFLNTLGEIDLPKLAPGRESQQTSSTRKVTTAQLNYSNLKKKKKEVHCFFCRG